MICPTCRGTKQQIIIVHENGTKSQMKIKCTTCDGTGQISQERRDQMERERKMWCSCGYKGTDLIFYDDDQHPEIYKHHWRCPECNGVVQIG